MSSARLVHTLSRLISQNTSLFSQPRHTIAHYIYISSKTLTNQLYSPTNAHNNIYIYIRVYIVHILCAFVRECNWYKNKVRTVYHIQRNWRRLCENNHKVPRKVNLAILHLSTSRSFVIDAKVRNIKRIPDESGTCRTQRRVSDFLQSNTLSKYTVYVLYGETRLS